LFWFLSEDCPPCLGILLPYSHSWFSAINWQAHTPGLVLTAAKDRHPYTNTQTIHLSWQHYHITNPLASFQNGPDCTLLSHPTSHALLTSPTPRRRELIYGACISTAQVGASLAAPLDSFFKRSSLRSLHEPIPVTWYICESMPGIVCHWSNYDYSHPAGTPPCPSCLAGVSLIRSSSLCFLPCLVSQIYTNIYICKYMLCQHSPRRRCHKPTQYIIHILVLAPFPNLYTRPLPWLGLTYGCPGAPTLSESTSYLDSCLPLLSCLSLLYMYGIGLCPHSELVCDLLVRGGRRLSSNAHC